MKPARYSYYDYKRTMAYMYVTLLCMSPISAATLPTTTSRATTTIATTATDRTTASHDEMHSSRLAPATTSTSQQQHAFTTTTLSPMCSSDTSQEIEQCVASFIVDWDSYSHMDATQRDEQHRTADICREYTSALMCLNRAFQHCTPEIQHLSLIQVRIGYLREQLKQLCFIRKPATTTTTTTTISTPQPSSTTTTATLTTAAQDTAVDDAATAVAEPEDNRTGGGDGDIRSVRILATIEESRGDVIATSHQRHTTRLLAKILQAAATPPELDEGPEGTERLSSVFEKFVGGGRRVNTNHNTSLLKLDIQVTYTKEDKRDASVNGDVWRPSIVRSSSSSRSRMPPAQRQPAAPSVLQHGGGRFSGFEGYDSVHDTDRSSSRLVYNEQSNAQMLATSGSSSSYTLYTYTSSLALVCLICAIQKL